MTSIGTRAVQKVSSYYWGVCNVINKKSIRRLKFERISVYFVKYKKYVHNVYDESNERQENGVERTRIGQEVCDPSDGENGWRGRLKQVLFDERAGGVWCGRRVRLRIADVSRGRDDGGRDGQAVVVSGHVLRAVRGDHRRGGRGEHGRGGGRHERSGQGHGQAGRRGGGHDGEGARDEREQRLENINLTMFNILINVRYTTLC